MQNNTSALLNFCLGRPLHTQVWQVLWQDLAAIPDGSSVQDGRAVVDWERQQIPGLQLHICFCSPQNCSDGRIMWAIQLYFHPWRPSWSPAAFLSASSHRQVAFKLNSPLYWHRYSLEKLISTFSLFPKGSVFQGPGPYRDLFYSLGPYRVPTYISGSIFSMFRLNSCKKNNNTVYM